MVNEVMILSTTEEYFEANKDKSACWRKIKTKNGNNREIKGAPYIAFYRVELHQITHVAKVKESKIITIEETYKGTKWEKQKKGDKNLEKIFYLEKIIDLKQVEKVPQCLRRSCESPYITRFKGEETNIRKNKYTTFDKFQQATCLNEL
jgi:hypothetical protein